MEPSLKATIPDSLTSTPTLGYHESHSETCLLWAAQNHVPWNGIRSGCVEDCFAGVHWWKPCVMFTQTPFYGAQQEKVLVGVPGRKKFSFWAASLFVFRCCGYQGSHSRVLISICWTNCWICNHDYSSPFLSFSHGVLSWIWQVKSCTVKGDENNFRPRRANVG